MGQGKTVQKLQREDIWAWDKTQAWQVQIDAWARD
jgi:hypothetical protein